MSLDIAEAEQNISHLKSEIDRVRTEKDEEIRCLTSEVKRLRVENEELNLNEAAFKDKDEKNSYFIGLPSWQVLYTLLQCVRPYLKVYSTLTPFQQLLVTLMRLRLNLASQDLAYRFRVHSSTISRTSIHVLGILLKPLIIWPDRDTLLKTMPVDFRKHCPKCVVIIDCFELSLRAQQIYLPQHRHTHRISIAILLNTSLV